MSDVSAEMKSLKVMVLSPDLPFPVIGGGRMRTVSLLKSLSRCAQVEMVCLSTTLPPDTVAWARKMGINLSIVPPKSEGTLNRVIRRIITLATWSNLEFDPAVAENIGKRFGEIKPDVVWLETPYLIRYALKFAGQRPVVVDYWGTSEGAERDFNHAAGLGKVRHWIRWMTALGGEKRYAPRVTDIVTVSAGDAEHFRKLAPACRIHPVSMGVEVQTTAQPAAVKEDPLLMIMTGDLSYKPNIDAACYFAKSILPSIRRQVSGAKILFAGSSPCREVMDLATMDGVIVRGFVPDLGALIGGAAVYVLPMRLGSGIRTKLFDVFPVSRPIVTTSTGAEGLALVDGMNCVIADADEAFARACIQLLCNEGERRRLGDAARELIHTEYSQETSDLAVRQVLDAVQRGQE